LHITGNQNFFAGVGAGSGITTGQQNSFFGRFAGLSNTTGNANSFFGTSAGQTNTAGADNSFFGVASGSGNTTGSSSFRGQDGFPLKRRAGLKLSSHSLVKAVYDPAAKNKATVQVTIINTSQDVKFTLLRFGQSWYIYDIEIYFR